VSRRTASVSAAAALLALAPFSLAVPGCSPRNADGEYTTRRGGDQQDVAHVHSDNEKMNAAMEEARRTLPSFFSALRSPKEGQEFLVKVRVTDGTTTEHMWLLEPAYDGKKLKGRLADDPYEVKGYRMGQEVSVAPAEVSDWIIQDGDLSRGGYTEKVLEESDLKQA
jgi:uncharacterized protein YegJ (DUF2314 family)